MIQQWLTVVGIALDFAGFMLLLREWWLAFFNEEHQIAMEEQLERMRAVRNIRLRKPGEPNPYETIERMQDEQAIRKARASHRSAMAARRGIFLISPRTNSYWKPSSGRAANSSAVISRVVTIVASPAAPTRAVRVSFLTHPSMHDFRRAAFRQLVATVNAHRSCGR